MTEILDMSRFIEAKSDQLNADDLIGTSKTITITKVTGSDGDQPVSIHYEGDQGKPWKPCKTMRRVLVGIWGKHAQEYVGRTLVLYRDDRVTFGGLEVGGIRISHASHLDKETVVVVMKSKGKKVGIKVLPLTGRPQKPSSPVPLMLKEIAACADRTTLRAWWGANNEAIPEDDYAQVLGVFNARLAAVPKTAQQTPRPAATGQGDAPQEDDGAAAVASQLAHEGRDESEMGEHDPIRETADRLINDARDGVIRSAVDQGHYEALPDEMRAEVDAAGREEG